MRRADLLKLPLSDIGLPLPHCRRLAIHGVHTVGQAVRLSAENPTDMYGIGANCGRSLRFALNEHGLDLREPKSRSPRGTTP